MIYWYNLVSGFYKESIIIVLYTIKEYAKIRGLSEVGIRKQVSSKYHQSIKIGKEVYIIEDDTIIKKLKQNLKNKNSQIRELKLKLELQTSSNDERYINELNTQISKLEKKLKKKGKEIAGLQSQKDTMYEKFLATLVNQKSITQ